MHQSLIPKLKRVKPTNGECGGCIFDNGMSCCVYENNLCPDDGLIYVEVEDE